MTRVASVQAAGAAEVKGENAEVPVPRLRDRKPGSGTISLKLSHLCGELSMACITCVMGLVMAR